MIKLIYHDMRYHDNYRLTLHETNSMSTHTTFKPALNSSGLKVLLLYMGGRAELATCFRFLLPCWSISVNSDKNCWQRHYFKTSGIIPEVQNEWRKCHPLPGNQERQGYHSHLHYQLPRSWNITSNTTNKKKEVTSPSQLRRDTERRKEFFAKKLDHPTIGNTKENANEEKTVEKVLLVEPADEINNEKDDLCKKSLFFRRKWLIIITSALNLMWPAN